MNRLPLLGALVAMGLVVGVPVPAAVAASTSDTGGGVTCPTGVSFSRTDRGLGASVNNGAASGPSVVQVGDVDGDGNADVVVLDKDSDDVSVFKGNGSGGFATPVPYGFADTPFSLTVGDYNHDGIDDFAATYGVPNLLLDTFLGAHTGDPTDVTSTPNGGGLDMTSGQFAGDGNVDIAAAPGGSSNSSVRVLTGNGNGSFGGGTDYSTGAGTALAVASADFDGDGKADLVTANYTANSVSVLLRNGSGFGAPTVVPVPGTAESVTTGDFNDDGHQDIAVASGPSVPRVYLLLGDGSGRFSSRTSYPIGGNVQDIVAGDFNHDGNLDLATANQSDNNVTVLIGTGTGDFAGQQNFAVGNGPRSLAVGDFNHDGRTDLATANYGATTMTVLTNTTRSTTDTAPVGNPDSYITDGPLSVAAPGVLANDTDADCDVLTADLVSGPAHGTLDLHADGSFDYTPASGYLGGDSFTYRADDGQLQSGIVTVSLQVTKVHAVDDTASVTEAHAVTVDVLANDSSPGGALSVTSVTQPTYGTATITHGGADVTYSAPDNYFGTQTFSYTATDAEGYTATAHVRVTVNPARGCATPSFAAGQPVPLPATYLPPYSLAVGDFDGDGHLDLADARPDSVEFDVSFGDGTGAFSRTQAYGMDRSLYENLVAADLNGDGFTDLATPATNNNQVVVRLADGHGDFGPVQGYDAGNNGADRLAVGDVDGDGIPDLVLVGFGHVSWFRGDGTGGFGPRTDLVPTDTVASSPTLGDLNGDGHEDLVVANVNGTVSFFLGDGAGGFTQTANVPEFGSQAYQNITTGDFNGDGNLDVAVNTEFKPVVTILYGDGAGGVIGTQKISAGSQSFNYNPVAADVNGDGRTDLVTGNGQNATVNLWLDHGLAGLASTPTSVHLPAGYDGGASVAAGDFDGDGAMDLAASTGEPAVVTFHNQCTSGGAPVSAADDSYSTIQDTVLHVSAPGVLANDSGAVSLTATRVSGPAHGALTLNPDGSFSYAPNAGYHGADSFTYRASEGHRGSATATVKLTVSPPNRPPVATDDSTTVAEDASATTVPVLANDTDPDGNALSVSAVTQPAHGTAAVTHGGSDVSYTPAPGYHGPDSFGYTVSDGHGGSATATVDVTVRPRSTVRVLTYDVGRPSAAVSGARTWAHRRGALVDQIRRSRAAVVGLQDAMHTAVDGARRRVVHPIADLQARLPAYDVTGSTRSLAAPNLILYRHATFALLRSGWRSLSAGVASTKRCPTVRTATAEWAVLADRDTGQRYFVVDTALSPDGSSATGRRHASCALQRAHESTRLIRLISARNHTTDGAPLPVIVLGDLGADHPKRALRILDAPQQTGGYGYDLDAVFGLVAGSPTVNAGWDADYANDTDRVDYLFHSAQLSVSQAHVLRRRYHVGGTYTTPSPHYAVTATYTIV